MAYKSPSLEPNLTLNYDKNYCPKDPYPKVYKI